MKSYIGVWCIGGMLGSEPGGREFDSLHPDMYKLSGKLRVYQVEYRVI